jgi:hypothetical protein
MVFKRAGKRSDGREGKIPIAEQHRGADILYNGVKFPGQDLPFSCSSSAKMK